MNEETVEATIYQGNIGEMGAQYFHLNDDRCVEKKRLGALHPAHPGPARDGVTRAVNHARQHALMYHIRRRNEGKTGRQGLWPPPGLHTI